MRRGVDWGGKDRALNAYDLHHLHLKPANAAGKRSGGSNELLYVGVGRDEMLLMMLGDHRSFDSGELRQAVADWNAEAGRELRGVVGLSRETSADTGAELMVRGINAPTMSGEKVTIPTFLATSGHSIHHVRHADRITITLEEWEPLLDTENSAAKLRARLGEWVSDNADWEWQLDGLNLVLVDKNAQKAGLLVNWHR